MRQLRSDERALWARVAATVRPLRPTESWAEAAVPPVAKPEPVRTDERRPASRVPPAPVGGGTPRLGDGLDAGWDRRLARGLVQPDMTIDLHGHTLAGAHAFLGRRLDDALAQDARLVLLVTGKPREEGRTSGRGAIRAAVEDWLMASRHAADIAAVRPAHRRHGGGGALYLVLRRKTVRHRKKS